MKRILAMLLTLLLTMTLFAGCGGNNGNSAAETLSPLSTDSTSPDTTTTVTDRADFTVTDMVGRQVTIPGNAKSFACIGPGCLRLYCYVADKARLAGIEEMDKDVTGKPYMMVNSDLTKLTDIGQGGPNNAPDSEKLLVAAPDVIFTTYTTDVSAIDKLQTTTGIPVVALYYYGTAPMFDPKVDQSFELIGKIAQCEDRAKEVVDYFASIKADLTKRTADIADVDKPTIYLGALSMKGSHGIESTSGNYEIFNVLNAKNVVDATGVSGYNMIDKEALIEMNPDVIILDAGGYSLVKDDYAANKAYYQSLSAFKNGKVYLQMPYNYYATNFEVALADAYYIGSVLYPEKFSDINIKEKFDEISEKMLGAKVYDKFAETYYSGYQQANFGS